MLCNSGVWGLGGEGGCLSLPGQPAAPALEEAPWRGGDPQGVLGGPTCQSTGFLDFEADL